MNKVPDGVSEIVSEVNVFMSEVEPQDPIGPMICSGEIDLNEDEMALLTKGPRYMMRNELDLK